MTTETPTIAVTRLSDSEVRLDEPNQDVRGRKLRDHSASEIGTIDDVLVDPRERKLRHMLVRIGGFLGLGAKTVVVPVDAVTAMRDDWVQVAQAGDGIADAPSYDPRLLADEEHHREIYHWYGYRPPWAPEYVYPSWRRSV